MPFYNALRKLLAAHKVDCTFVYDPNTASNLIQGDCDWAQPVAIRWFGPIGWQPVLHLIKGADLIVVHQEVKYLLNHALIARHRFGGPRLAFWGHGRNMQARNRNSWPERVKRFLSKRVDWWFAYNERSAAVVRKLGFPNERITIVQNAIDTKSLIEARNTLSQEVVESTKSSLGIDSANVAIYTGGLYEEKRIPFLLQAASKVRAKLPDFHLIIIGGGPQKDLVAQAARDNPWIHYLGPKNDMEKLPYWAISKVSLMPGLVGLGVLDSFALGVPLIATAYPYHSPEIEYLRDGVNGIVVNDWESSDAYANAVVHLLQNDRERESMASEGRRAAEFYTIENMAENFTQGILAALRS